MLYPFKTKVSQDIGRESYPRKQYFELYVRYFYREQLVEDQLEVHHVELPRMIREPGQFAKVF